MGARIRYLDYNEWDTSGNYTSPSGMIQHPTQFYKIDPTALAALAGGGQPGGINTEADIFGTCGILATSEISTPPTSLSSWVDNNWSADNENLAVFEQEIAGWCNNNIVGNLNIDNRDYNILMIRKPFDINLNDEGILVLVYFGEQGSFII